MRLGIIILMIIILMAHAFSFPLIYISFKINQEYIVANLCVQKDEPVNTCHGHCQLTNKMQDHEKQKNDDPLIQEGWMNFCFLKSGNRFMFQLMLSQVRNQTIFTSSSYTSLFIHNIFHPPK
jgi:hypothetical protein